MFFFNFLFWLMGALLAGIGCYAVVDKWASGEGFRLENVFDIIFNLAFLLVIIGGIVFIVSTFSKNKCFLKINVFKRESNLQKINEDAITSV